MELGADLGHTQARLKVTGQIIGIYAINRRRKLDVKERLQFKEFSQKVMMET